MDVIYIKFNLKEDSGAHLILTYFYAQNISGLKYKNRN